MKDKKETKKISELLKKNKELEDGWKRTQADFINYKNQAANDRVNLIKTANAGLLLDILPVLDNFQLAATHTPKKLADDAWVQGIGHIERHLELVLIQAGLRKIETVGEKFDPKLHEAVEHIKSDKPQDEIVEEIQPGYTFDNNLLRPAKVKVSKGK